MKPLLIVILILLITTTAFSQDLEERKLQFGLKGGVNLSKFSAQYSSKAQLKPGANAGLYIRRKYGENVHLRTELYYSSEGEKTQYMSGTQTVAKTQTTVNSINLPILFEYGHHITIQAGPQIGFLLSGNEKGALANGKAINDDLGDLMRSVDVSLVLGIGIYDGEHLNFGARYNLGLTPVFDTPNGAPADYPTFANRVIHLYLGWSF